MFGEELWLVAVGLVTQASRTGGRRGGVRYARARDCARIITVSETSIEYLESFWIEPRAFDLSEAFKGRS